MAKKNEESTKAKTLYVVLRDMGVPASEPMIGVPLFAVLGEIEANSGDEACRHLAEQLETEGNFRAVPARSWREVPVEKEVVSRYAVKKAQTTLDV
jgi:hypothetical protein